jgi:hypothetical protein
MHTLRISARWLAVLIVMAGFDATLLEGKLWTELKVQTTRYALGVEPELARQWSRLRGE